MKLYTEEQVRQAWSTAYIDALAIDEEDYKPNFYDDFIKTITPIELPSNEKIESKLSRANPYMDDLEKVYNEAFLFCAKWMKELIINQNKQKHERTTN